MRIRLDNGLTALLLPSHASPVVAFQAWIGVGSADEMPDEAGIAHVFEHMLFKGTDRRGVGQIAQEIEAAGGDINAWTSFDNTVYHLVLASRYFDTGLDILADAVLHSSFDPTELQRELGVVLEEVKQGEDNPSRVLTQALFAKAFTKHPYRRPVIGWEKTIKSFTRAKLLQFFQKWYVPSNITLVIVGDFDPDDAIPKIKKAWGSAKKKNVPRAERVEPPQKTTRAVVLTQDVREAQMQIAFHIPGIRAADTAALDVAAIVLGQGDSSRLNFAVRRNRQLVSEVYAYSYTPKDPGILVTGATLPPGNPEEAFRAILREVFRLAHEDVSEEELAKARTIIESDIVYQKETVQGMARKLGFFEVVAGGVDYEAEYYRQIQQLTAADLRRVAQQYLTTTNMTIGVLQPEADARKAPKVAAALEAKLPRIAREEEQAATARWKAPKVGANAEVVRTVLPNGVRILVKREADVPVVAYRAVWVGGLRYEDERTNGINNLIASLITRGTTTRGAEEIIHEVEGMAGSIGGFSGRNSFGVRAELLSRNWERGLEIMADCILHPEFPDDELDKERRQVLDELSAQEDNLTSVAFRLFSETLYRKHPYRLDALGSATSVRAFTRQALADYYRRMFPLGEVTIAIVGDVDPAKVIAKVTGLFGVVDERKHVAPKIAREDLWHRPANGNTGGAGSARGPIEVYRFLAKQQAHMVIGFPGTTIDDADRFALEVLSTVLSGQGGRLFVELRDKQALAYRVNAFSLEGIDPGYFAVYIACSPDKLPAALAGIKVELAKVIDTPIDKAELDRAKKYLVGSHEISLQRRSALASTLAFHESYGMGWDEYRRYAAGILKIDAATVQRVAKQYLDWNVAVIATVKPEELTPGAQKRRNGTKKKPAVVKPATRAKKPLEKRP